MKLAAAITDLYGHTSSPYDLFIAETLRTIGMPIAGDEPPEPIRDELAAAVRMYIQEVDSSEPFLDILGPVFSEVSSHGRRQNAGQFFTPWSLAVMMAEMQLGDWKPEPHEDGTLWSMLEPAAGAGAMVLAALATIVKHHGPEALLLWYVHAVELDLAVARTCAVQILMTLSRYGWGLGKVRVEHGNSLSMETFSVILHGTARRPHPLLAPAAVVSQARRAAQQLVLFTEAGAA